MGLEKHWRTLAILALACLAAISLTPGCKSRNGSSVSSQSFLAPQLTPFDPNTGLNADGVQSVEVVVSKIQVLRESQRKPDGTVPLDSVLLQGTPPDLQPLGKIDANRLLVFDRDTKTLLTMNLETNKVLRVYTRDEFLLLFRGQVQKPKVQNAVQLQNGWILCYEFNSKSLFAVRENGAGGIVANQVLDQTEIQTQTAVPPLFTKVILTIQSLTEFEANHVMVIPQNNVAKLHHLVLEEGVGTGGTPILKGKFVLNDDNLDGIPEAPLLDYVAIRNKTGNIDIDIKDFPPVVIPDTVIPGNSKVLVFDRAKATSSFLGINITKAGAVYHATVDLLANRNDLTNAILHSTQTNQPFDGQFRFVSSFMHSGALLDPTDPKFKPWILTFDSETNNILAFDWTQPFSDPDKIRVFSSSTQLSSPFDLHQDPNLDTGTFEPDLLFAQNDVENNRLVFDAGPQALLGMNYETGNFVVVLHTRDISRVTQVGLATLNYIEALEPVPPDEKIREIRALDLQSGNLLAIRIEYLPIPVSHTQ